MKKILLISFGEYEYDGRLRNLICILESIGELYYITRGKTSRDDRHYVLEEDNYFKFINKTIKFAKKLDGIDVLFLDNRKATIPGLILNKVLKPKFLIQDCRELYEPKELDHIVGKIGCYFERKSIKKADIVIAANESRAKKMVEIYDLNKKPIVYENLRQLQYSNRDGVFNAQKDLYRYIKEDEFRIISTAGCDVSRLTDTLVKNMKHINYKYRLFLVGDSKIEDYHKIKDIIETNNIENVEIINRLDQDYLKYLISYSHIGIVSYHQKDLNNKYCASGKIYEFLYEGVPVVTTSNPPLKELCDEWGIGVVDNQFYKGINEIISNHEHYKSKVDKYIKTNDINFYNNKLKSVLEKEIE